MKTLPSTVSHTEPFIIRTYEVDHQKICTAPAIIKLMDEASMQNVLNLKLSVWDLEKDSITWVLMRKYLIINRLPDLNERINIYTSPAGFEKFFTYRDYKVYAENGDLLAYSSSTWLLMDTEKRRMTRIPSYILAMNDQMPSLENCLERPAKKLPKFETADYEKTFQVGWYDLDFNGHLNNNFYTKWMLEAMPHTVLKNKKLLDFQIEYRMEGRLEDTVVSEVKQVNETTFLHRLVRDGNELALGQTVWG
ncbi:MAG: medium-chain acyl-[acyl-carrier-protein] hydrolase [Paraglaciecola sp.]|jgi:medium-chain acyl-[acyl-carrier-protein] hydrolase